MAKINDLVKQVTDVRLRRELETAVAELKKRTRFGLVYESHLPETTALPGLQVREGVLVVKKNRLSALHAFRVVEISNKVATLESVADGTEHSAPLDELVVLQRFGEPIYPGLEKVGSVERRYDDEGNGPTGQRANGPTGQRANGPTGQRANGPTGHITQ